jgi:hypothetical protein
MTLGFGRVAAGGKLHQAESIWPEWRPVQKVFPWLARAFHGSPPYSFTVGKYLEYVEQLQHGVSAVAYGGGFFLR